MTLRFSVTPLNPVFADNVFRVTGSSDATKIAAFEVDGFTTGTTRTFTLPDADAVVAGSAAALTSGRVPFVTTGGLLTDASGFTFAGSLLKAATLSVGSSALQSLNDAGSAVISGLQINDTGAPGSSIAACRWTNSVNAPRWFLAKSRGASVGTFAIVSSGDDLGHILFDGDDGAALQTAARITAQVDASPSAGVMPGRLLILTSPTTTSTPIERLRVDSAGLVTLHASNSTGLTIAKTSGTTLVVSSTATASVTLAGGATVAGDFEVTTSTNGIRRSGVTNTSNGASARARFGLTNDVSTTLNNTVYSSGGTTSAWGQALANWVTLHADGASLGGMQIGNLQSGTPIVFGIGSSEVARFVPGGLTVGGFTVNYTTDSTSLATGAFVCSGGGTFGKRLTLDGATGKTLRIVNGVANAAVATTLGSKGPTGSTAGDPQGWMRVDINGTDRYIPYW